jgi:hypothetical protein
MSTTKKNAKQRGGQAGYVLILVLLLIIMFSGLGVLAMRHTRQELRSSGAYLDATQAADLVRGALALVATDLRRSSDYYEYQLLASETASGDAGVEEYEIPLNETLFPSSTCASTTHAGCVAYLTTPGLYGAEALYGVDVTTYMTQKAPQVGPCPPGFSCFDDQNYGWYTFTVDATASYGSKSKDSSTLFELGRAQGRGRMTVGPISVFGR